MDIHGKLCIKSSGQGGEKGTDRHGDEIVAEFRAGDDIGKEHDGKEHDQDDVIIWLLGGKHEIDKGLDIVRDGLLLSAPERQTKKGENDVRIL